MSPCCFWHLIPLLLPNPPPLSLGPCSLPQWINITTPPPKYCPLSLQLLFTTLYPAPQLYKIGICVLSPLVALWSFWFSAEWFSQQQVNIIKDSGYFKLINIASSLPPRHLGHALNCKVCRNTSRVHIGHLCHLFFAWPVTGLFKAAASNVDLVLFSVFRYFCPPSACFGFWFALFPPISKEKSEIIDLRCLLFSNISFNAVKVPLELQNLSTCSYKGIY